MLALHRWHGAAADVFCALVGRTWLECAADGAANRRASPLSAFAWLDMLVSALAVIVFVLYEGRRLHMPRAWLALPGLCVGVSLALPLFLWMREGHMQQGPAGRERKRVGG